MLPRQPRLKAEIVATTATADRGRKMLRALLNAASAADVDASWSNGYIGDRELLVLYGIGAPIHQALARQHLEAGGRVIAWDLGYWGRERNGWTTRLRLTVDGPHPQAFVMRRDLPAERFEALEVPRHSLFDPAGHIVIVGMGPKSCVQYGWHPLDWPRKAVAIARERWPGRRLVYRPKKPTDPVLPDIPAAVDGPIAEVLAGASLVLTNHSNVAVDALCAGIPALVNDGAAAAICGRPESGEPVLPDAEVLERFLRNLAWFQWSPAEVASGAVWPFLRDVLER